MRPIALILIASAVALAGQVAALENANVEGPEQAPVVREPVPFTARITVRNPNDRAIRVRKIDSSCTCVKLVLADHFILPNATSTLDVVIDNANRSGPQRQNVSIYTTDPDLNPIEVFIYWQVRAAVQVDAINPQTDPLERPADRNWHDIYKYSAKARPDEPQRLRKRIRLSCPPEEVPAGGLKVSAIEYAGSLWKFTPQVQANGSILITAEAAEGTGGLIEGLRQEKVTVVTNHPDKARIVLDFISLIAKNAGEVNLDPTALPPPGIPGPPGPAR